MLVRRDTVLFVSLAAMLAVMPATGLAQDATPQSEPTEQTPPEPVELHEHVYRQIQSNPDKFIQATIQKLYQMNASGTVTRADVQRFERIEVSRSRSRVVSTYLHLDVDGDGVISSEELKMVSATEAVARRAQYDVLLLEADVNQDSEISHAELIGFAENKIAKARASGRARSLDPMAFDLDGDGKVDPAELVRAVRKFASEEPKDGPKSKKKIKVVGTNRRPDCVVPVAPKDAQIVLLSGYEGWAVSTVAVNGPDRKTSVASITIEPGDEPLYIFAVAYDPIVWKIDGATERVVKFVAQPQHARQGAGVAVVGLAKDKVAFAVAASCANYFTNSDDARGRIAGALITAQLERNIDHTIAHHKLSRVSVPSGVVEKVDKKKSRRSDATTDGMQFVLKDGKVVKIDIAGGQRTARSFRGSYPGGIVQIDLKDVVAPAPVDAYDVLPKEAGLLQLISEGAMQYTTDGYYVIKKDVPRFPAGLAGSHSVRFLIAKGVAMPEGSAGHSSVFLEETGECASGLKCRR